MSNLPNPSPPFSDRYKREALGLLQVVFPFLSVDAARCAFQYCQNHFSQTHRFLKSVDQQRRRQEGKDASAIDDEVRKAMRPCFDKVRTRIFILKPRYNKKGVLKPRDAALLKEIESIPKLAKEFAQKKRLKSSPVVDGAAGGGQAATTISADMLMECGCCFGDFPFDVEEMCQCTDGHVFCHTCVRNHVNEQVFGNVSTEVRCMSLDGCQAQIPRSAIEQALPDVKALRSVDAHLARANIDKAGIEDL